MHIFFSKNLNFFASTCPPASFVMAKLIQIKQLIATLVLVFYPPFGLMAVLLFLSYMLSMVLVLWEVGAILGHRYGTQGQN